MNDNIMHGNLDSYRSPPEPDNQEASCKVLKVRTVAIGGNAFMIGYSTVPPYQTVHVESLPVK